MKSPKHSTGVEKQGWSWFLNPEIYDQCPELSTAEKLELGYWVNHNGRGYGLISDATAEVLQRLMQPLNDTIATLDLPSRYSERIAIQVMLLEMHRRGTSFWAWSSTDWIETIGKSQEEFQQRFDKVQGRQHLLAISYVLLEFMDFWGLPFERSGLATKVFGKDRVNAEIERILITLGEQGYGVAGDQRGVAESKYESVGSNLSGTPPKSPTSEGL